MRKRRSTVYVSPGKDVTLYVPADTPQVVIDYLNRLKDEGQFSQGVMDILIQHVSGSSAEQLGGDKLSRDQLGFPETPVMLQDDLPLQQDDEPITQIHSLSNRQASDLSAQDTADSADPADSMGHMNLMESPEPSETPVSSESAVQSATLPFHLRMADIFRQAQKNSGKLVDARADSATD